MAGNVLWTGYFSTAATVLSTELNSLTSNNVTALGAEQDNSTDNYEYADAEIFLDTINVSSTTAEVRLYLVSSLDGTNYPEFDTGTTSPGAHNNNYYVGSIKIKNSNASHRGKIRGILLPQGKYKWAVRNVAGVTLAASSNTLRVRTYSERFT